MSVTLALGFKAQTGSFTTITNFREKVKVLFNYSLSELPAGPRLSVSCNISGGEGSSALCKCLKQTKAAGYSELSKQLGDLTGT